jgi:hypothetical protein
MATVLGDERLFGVDLGVWEAPQSSAPAGEAKTFRPYDQKIEQLEAEVKSLLEEAERVDACGMPILSAASPDAGPQE